MVKLKFTVATGQDVRLIANHFATRAKQLRFYGIGFDYFAIGWFVLRPSAAKGSTIGNDESVTITRKLANEIKTYLEACCDVNRAEPDDSEQLVVELEALLEGTPPDA